MTPKQYAQGLRALADWFEKQPDNIPIPSNTISHYIWGFEVPEEQQKDLAIQISKSFGMAEKEYFGESFILSRDFGGITLAYRFNRNVVCTARVVGTKQVEEHLYVKTGRMIDEDIIEWDCHPLLTNERGNK